MFNTPLCVRCDSSQDLETCQSFSSLAESPSVNLLVKLPGTFCNYSCAYCFEHLKKAPNSYQGFVTVDGLKSVLREVDLPVNVVFHGGEPLLYPIDGFREMLKEIRKFPNVKYIQIQTNGSLLTQAHVDLFWREFSNLKIEISISLDGDRESNHLRRDAQGKETFNNVLNAYSLLHANGVKAGLLSVLHRGSIGRHMDYVNMLSGIPNVSFVKLNALHLMDGDRLTGESVSPTEYMNLACQIHAEYVKRKMYERFPIEPFLGAMQAFRGMDSKYCNFSNRKCNNFICLYPSGKLTLCDSLPMSDFSLGGFAERMSAVGLLNELQASCAKCPLVNFCRGGCLGLRFQMRNNSDLMRDYCISRLMLYRYIGKILNSEVRDIGIQ